jgi:hypothetical protein
MRKILAILALLASAAAHAQLVQNPLIVPSTSFVAGDCIQATGPNSVATTGSACGTGSGGAGNVTGPTSSNINDVAAFSNAAGTGILDTGIAFSHIGILGNTQTWTGVNAFIGDASFTGPDPVAFALRPTFGGNLAWDAGNLPSPFQTTGGTITGATAFSLRPTFAGNTPWDSGNFNPALYLPLTGGTVTGSVIYSGLTGHPYFTGASGTYRGAYYQTNGVNRWTIGPDIEAEQGSDTGSNWVLGAYHDDGSLSVTAITVTRATGQAQFQVRPTFAGQIPWDQGNFNPSQYALLSGANAFTSATPNTFSVRPTFNGATPWDSANLTPSNYLPVATPTATGSLTVNGQWVTITRPSGSFGRYTTNTGAYPTWEWGTDGTAQTGSNAGSNFGLYAFSDTGAYISQPIAITRSTGAIAFGSDPTAPTPATGTNSTALATTQYTQTALTGDVTSPAFVNLSASGSSVFTGAATFNGAVATNNTLTAASVSTPTLTVSGNSTHAGTAVFNGAAVFNNTLSATSMSASGEAYAGTLDVTGNTTLGTSGNTVQVEGTLNVTGGASIGGNVTLGTGTDVITVNSYLNVSGPVTIHNYTVATLPTGSLGMRASVSDANICGFNSYVAGGGSLFCPVIYNGSGWVGG